MMEEKESKAKADARKKGKKVPESSEAAIQLRALSDRMFERKEALLAHDITMIAQ